MKTLFIILLVSISLCGYSQTPQAFNYQAVLRDATGNVLANQEVSLQFSIIASSVDGKPIYQERHFTTTNQFGLINLQIGNGMVSTGSFSLINWGGNTHFLQIAVDNTGGTNFTVMGTSQILSVPYALYAKTAESITGTVNETDPVYTTSQAANITSTDITNISNLSGTNTGDQDLSELTTQNALEDTASNIRADIPDVNGFINNEVDPVFSASQAANITAIDITNLSNLSGINTGDQNLSSHTTQEALEDTASAIRKDIPDVSGFIDNESDPMYLAWDKDYSDLTNTPVTISESQADAILANSGKDTTGIYHINRAAIDLISGTNSGDQELSMDGGNLSISNGNTVAIPDEVDDADADPTNELQIMSISEDSIFLSDGGYVILPHPGPYFISSVTYPIGGLGSPYTIDLTEDIPNGVKALICVVEFFNRWHADFYGGSYLEAYYGEQSEDEKIRIENPIEDNYTQSGPIRIQMMIPVIDGNSLVLNHLGVNKIVVNGYFK